VFFWEIKKSAYICEMRQNFFYETFNYNGGKKIYIKILFNENH